jgi:hypothetical protein
MNKSLGIALCLLFGGLFAFGVGWMLKALARKDEAAEREKQLKNIILQDPKMRELYQKSGKQNPKEREK